MSAHSDAARVTIRFEAHLPHAQWGPLFHVFRLEQPHVSLRWRACGFPARDRSLLDGADAGLFLEPPLTPGLSGLTLATSPMVVIVPAGHRLAGHDVLSITDILAEPFPGAPSRDPHWTAFWGLDGHRGGPPRCTDDDVTSAHEGLEVVASGRAIATAAASVASGLSHPGVLALQLTNPPDVRTRLVWRTRDDNPVVRSLVDLARAWTGGADGDESRF